MAKKTKKALPLSALVSSDSVNARLADNYDLETLCVQIVAKGGITNPLAVEPMPGEKDRFMVLQGNRRKRAADLLVSRHDTPDEVRKSLEKIECIIYEGLSDADRDGLIFDHGETRPLNREETVLAVWRLYKQFAKEKEIGQRLYYQLARYSGNEKKLAEMPTDPHKRNQFLSDWFRGTLGQYILAAASMPDEVREQFLLTARKEDGRLKEGEKVSFLCTRARIVELSKARTADEKAAGWSREAGGEHFNALVQKFKDEDAGKAEPDKPAGKLSVKELKRRASLFDSAALKAAFNVAAGDETAGVALLSMDASIHRTTLVFEVLSKYCERIKDPTVRALVVTLLGSGPAADVEAALQPLLTT